MAGCRLNYRIRERERERDELRKRGIEKEGKTKKEILRKIRKGDCVEEEGNTLKQGI